MILWLRLPLTCATKPTPQLSCSNSGRYSPCAGGRPVLFGSRMLAVPHAARAFTTHRPRARLGAPRRCSFVCVALAVMVLTAVSRLAPLNQFLLQAGSFAMLTCQAAGHSICRGAVLNLRTEAGLVPTPNYRERPDAASITAGRCNGAQSACQRYPIPYTVWM